MEKYKQIIFKSKFGNIRISSEEKKITHVEFTRESLEKSNSKILNEAKIQIEEYFFYKRKKFSIKIELKGTEFQNQVWQQLQLIPYGKVSTYLDIAKVLETSPRAIGKACSKNSILLFIPCHRVIASNGNLSGFSALGGSNTKKKLLNHENIKT